MEKSKNLAEEELQRIGQRIKELRIAKGYSNYENFAYENDISRTQYGRYESGSNMTMSNFLKVLKGLEVSPIDFFQGLIPDSENQS